jgi:cellulose synthase/poly-beta-1,6-N-acetylglucosamine synthase-like glycosyltransferase
MMGLFWGSVSLIVYTYLVFPGMVLLRALWKSRRAAPAAPAADPAGAPGDPLPSLSFIIAAYNEAETIAGKLDNTVGLDYPQDRMEVIVASDGSDDLTNEIVAGYPSRRVRLLALPRQGKNRTINAAVPQAAGEILVFTDADSLFEPSALHFLIAPFADPQVGGVAGSYRYLRHEKEAKGERAYWRFDQKLRDLQSKGGDLVSATGHIYAIRRELFSPVPSGVTDDAYISRGVISRHRRLVFERRAAAYGPIADDAGEFRRKVRILSRGLKGVWEQRHLLNPFAYGFYALQLLTHKVLRRLMFLPIAITLLCALFLWEQGVFYQLAAVGQLALHAAALAGYVLRDSRLGKSRLLSLPYFLDMTNLACFLAVKRLLQGENRDAWNAERAVGETSTRMQP